MVAGTDDEPTQMWPPSPQGDADHIPPVLACVHGSVAGAEATFGGLRVERRRWTAGRRLLLVDRPGFADVDGPVGWVDQARHLLATVAAQAEGPVDLLGHGAGGLVALHAAAIDPAAVRSLTLVECQAPDLLPDRMVNARALLDPVVDGLHAAGEDSASVAAIARAALVAVDPALAPVADAWLRGGDPGVAVHAQDLAVWGAGLDRARLVEVTSGDPPIPVLAVTGGRTHPGMRTFGAGIAAALHGRHVTVPDAGHLTHLHPGFGDVVADHLAPVDPETPADQHTPAGSAP